MPGDFDVDRHLGTRDLLARSTITYTSAALLTCYLIGSPGLWPTSLLLRVLAILMGTTALFGVAAMASRLPHFGRNWFITAIVLALAAQAFVWTLGLAYILLGLDPAPGWFVLVPQGTVLAGTFLYVAARNARAVRVHEARVAELVRSSAALNSEREELAHQRQAWRREALGQIYGVIVSVLQSLRTLDAPELVERLRQVAHDVVRPMSHDMATPRNLTPTNGNNSQVSARVDLLRLVTTGRINPWAFAGIAFVLAVVLGTTVYSPLAGLEFALVVTVGAGLGGVFATELSELVAKWALGLQIVVRLVALTVLGLASMSVAVIVAGQSPLDFIPPLATPIYVAIGLSVSITTGVTDARLDIEGQLAEVVTQRRWALARENEEHYAERRQLARLVHGPLQAALNAAAIRLDMDIRAERDTTASRNRAFVDIARTRDELESPRQVDFTAGLDELAQTWSGSCTVVITLPAATAERIGRDPIASAAVLDIATEATTNAVRHGSASHIDLSIADDADSVIITATDNGIGVKPESSPGLGTAVLDQVALRWERASTPAGVTLHAVLPLERALTEFAPASALE